MLQLSILQTTPVPLEMCSGISCTGKDNLDKSTATDAFGNKLFPARDELRNMVFTDIKQFDEDFKYIYINA